MGAIINLSRLHPGVGIYVRAPSILRTIPPPPVFGALSGPDAARRRARLDLEEAQAPSSASDDKKADNLVLAFSVAFIFWAIY